MLKFSKKLLGIQSPNKTLRGDYSSVDSTHIVEDLLKQRQAAYELSYKQMTNAEAANVIRSMLNYMPIARGDGKSTTRMLYIEALCKAINALEKGE